MVHFVPRDRRDRDRDRGDYRGDYRSDRDRRRRSELVLGRIVWSGSKHRIARSLLLRR